MVDEEGGNGSASFFCPTKLQNTKTKQNQSREYAWLERLLERVQSKALRTTSALFHYCKSIYSKDLPQADSREAIFYGTAFLGWVTLELWDALSAAHRATQV